MARPITSAIVRGAITRSPGHLRWDTLVDILPDDEESRTVAREAVDRMERYGELERLDIGEHTVLKPTDAFEEPDNLTAVDPYLTGNGKPWCGWLRRARDRAAE